MAYGLIKEEILTDIADAIREVTKETETIKPSEMAEKISSIFGASVEPTLSLGALLNGTITEIEENVASVMRYSCVDRKQLKKVTLNNCTRVCEYAFSGCEALETVNIPSLEYIEKNAFEDTNLHLLNFPLVKSIGMSAFEDCSSIEKAYLPNVTSIGAYAFNWCSSLKEVDVTALQSISYDVFKNCTNLRTFILRSETLCVANSSQMFSGTTPLAKGEGFIYIPRALVDTYKTATNWTTYADRFRALEDYTVDGTITGALDETKI